MSHEPNTVETLQAAIQDALHHEDAAGAQGNVVTGWVIVAESMDVDGKRWLSRHDGGPGDRRLPIWQAQGLLHNALFSDGWTDEGDE